MAKFKFTGDPRPGAENPGGCTFVSRDGTCYVFELDGEAVEVADEEAQRLRTNNHFTEVKAAAKKKAKKKASKKKK